MNHTLKQLLANVASEEEADAFRDGRAELDSDVKRAEYDRDMEEYLMEKKRAEVVATRGKKDSPGRKRIETMQTR